MYMADDGWFCFFFIKNTNVARCYLDPRLLQTRPNFSLAIGTGSPSWLPSSATHSPWWVKWGPAFLDSICLVIVVVVVINNEINSVTLFSPNPLPSNVATRRQAHTCRVVL